MKELGVDRNIRKTRVSISGTNYKPLDNQFQIKVVPNPSPGEFYLTAKGLNNKNIKIEVMNAVGQIIYQTEQKVFQNDFNRMIDLNKMANGFYYIKVYVENKVYLRSIIKAN